MILRARERLRLSLGEDEFQRFEGLVTRAGGCINSTNGASAKVVGTNAGCKIEG